MKKREVELSEMYDQSIIETTKKFHISPIPTSVGATVGFYRSRVRISCEI